MISSLVLLFHSKYQLARQKDAAIALEEELSKETPAAPVEESGPQPAPEEGPAPQGPPQPQPAPAAVPEEDVIDKRSAIGVLRINDIGVVLPIYDNTSSKALWRGAGVVETTDLPSADKNTLTVLAGHRGGRQENLSFMRINKLPRGSEIRVTTRDQVLYYGVYGQEVVEPMDWSRFIREEDKSKLYLMTCHPYPKNNKRLLVKAELTRVVDK